MAADQARILKEREREERPEGGLTKTERNAFREIADRLRKQGLASSRSTSEPGALSEEAVADSPQPVAVEEAALHTPARHTAMKPPCWPICLYRSSSIRAIRSTTSIKPCSI